MDRKKRVDAILTTLKTTQIATTPQLEVFFKDYGSPKKRCSEVLNELEEEKWIEGQKNRPLGRAKAWRLAKKGRDHFNITKRSIPFNSRKIEHQLKITECFLELWTKGGLKIFQTEFRADFEYEGENKKYAPDGLFYMNDSAYALEVQKSPLSQARWQKKWDVVEEFYEKHGSIKVGNYNVKYPTIIVLTNQRSEIVRADSKLNLILIQSPKEIKRIV
jgi:hypothetical protein